MYKKGQIFNDYPPIEVIEWINEKQYTLEECGETEIEVDGTIVVLDSNGCELASEQTKVKKKVFQYKIIVPDGFIETNEGCRPMTNEELVKSNRMTQEELNSILNAQIIAQIRAIENTDEYKRKVRLAMTGDEIAKQWLVEKEAEIQVLRDGLV